MDNSKSRVIKLEGEKKKVTGQYPIQIVFNQQQRKRKDIFLNKSLTIEVSNKFRREEKKSC